MKRMFNKAFTIMEILIVVIIVGIIAGFSIPNYRKANESAYERDAVLQLSTLHDAEQLYHAREGGLYWPPDTTVYNVSQINSALDTSLIENGMTLTCTSPAAGGSAFTCTAQRAGGAFTLQLDETTLGSGNPCCSAGNCPTLAGC